MNDAATVDGAPRRHTAPNDDVGATWGCCQALDVDSVHATANIRRCHLNLAATREVQPQHRETKLTRRRKFAVAQHFTPTCNAKTDAGLDPYIRDVIKDNKGTADDDDGTTGESAAEGNSGVERSCPQHRHYGGGGSLLC